MDYSQLLPKRPKDVHKGQCGKVGLIAGSRTMIGAGILAARAALRTGSGLVYLLTIPEAAPAVNIAYPEIIVYPFETPIECDAFVMGPGLGSESWAMHHVDVPCVIDGDGLFEFQKYNLSNVILTPHGGEFERLFGTISSEDAAKSCGHIVVKKGPGTVITDGKKTVVNPTGNPGMATAGSGDVLSGVIASLIGQGLSLFDAAALGVYLHGLAGDLAYEQLGNGLIASDIIDFLPKALLHAAR